MKKKSWLRSLMFVSMTPFMYGRASTPHTGLLNLSLTDAKSLAIISKDYLSPNTDPVATLLCITGKYRPITWDNSDSAPQPGWILSNEDESLPGYTIGGCTSKQEKLFVRFKRGRVVEVAVLTVYSPFRDLGWQRYMNKFVSGISYTQKPIYTRTLANSNYVSDVNVAIYSNNVKISTMSSTNNPTWYIWFWVAPNELFDSSSPLIAFISGLIK